MFLQTGIGRSGTEMKEGNGTVDIGAKFSSQIPVILLKICKHGVLRSTNDKKYGDQLPTMFLQTGIGRSGTEMKEGNGTVDIGAKFSSQIPVILLKICKHGVLRSTNDKKIWRSIANNVLPDSQTGIGRSCRN
eukprot:Seg11086.1 transcript_id=Seg11086.1/GoldUCD/mRNA.D3Y31 product="hypothetical protein" protein_id=Seg11086.1/GoldUCD/D3Y31